MSDQPQTVYLAWTGSYSDARVVGVYSNRDTAMAVAKALDADDHHVEEAVVDGSVVPPEEAGLALWWAVSCINGPEVDECYRGQSWYGGIDRKIAIGHVVPAYGTKVDPLHVYIYARDEEHARKIAADKFREHFALWGMGSKP